ncbi:MAG: 2-amino-4-hydroxy-6-hydroxymethyldihydropteridine diphosphokinase [Nevskiaceae bacterium]
MANVWIALGANLGDPAAALTRALLYLRQVPDLRVRGCSRFYRSAPLGAPGQPDYCNAVCAAQTGLAPLAVLECLQEIETSLGRVAGQPRWSARAIDLDLLLYDQQVLVSERLSLPHAELHRRNFVLVPLAELAPELVIPGRGRVSELAHAIGREGLELWEPSPASGLL